MSIRARIEDAMFLWNNGHKEGAFLSALVAVASTAKRISPDRMAIGDRDAFEQFLKSAHSVRLSVEYRGELHTIEHIFYKWLRCELIHEGGLPTDLEFMPDTKPGTLSVRAGGAPEFVLKLSEGWFHFLVNSVVSAPINSDQFDSV